MTANEEAENGRDSVQEEMMSRHRRPPPQLMFDDGSRAILEETPLSNGLSHKYLRQNKSVEEYFEIDRLANEVKEYRRIALQFPDELLGDSPEVCWELEDRIPDALIFSLGDTTYSSCCPDVVAASHLQADCLIHFGHACLSTSTSSIPILYIFGKGAIDIEKCAEDVVAQSKGVRQILLFYELQYEHAMANLYKALSNSLAVSMARAPPASSRCCAHCADDLPTDSELDDTPINVGGLSLDGGSEIAASHLLFVGSDSSRQFLNIALRFLSGEDRPLAFWTYNPPDNALQTSLSPMFQRKLNRRYFLQEKAKLSSVFGILVAQLSNPALRSVVSRLRQLLIDHGRSSYTMAVGKVNPAKLANFAEIECFVLVACPEHSLLDDEREYPVDVITPLELCMALGVTDWGEAPYSLDAEKVITMKDVVDIEDFDVEEDDAPQFNLVTGRYESTSKADKDIDLSILPGQGKVTEYRSAAADYLLRREYQGLQVQAGQTPVIAASKGQEGIASNYGER